MTPHIVDYDHTNHGAFVRSTWAHGALRDGSRWARAVFDRHLAEPGARCKVAVVPDEFARRARLIGWAASTEDHRLIWAYVLPVMRRRTVAWALLAGLGYDVAMVEDKTGSRRRLTYVGSEPVPLLYWSPSAEQVARLGKVFYAPYQRKEATG